MVITFLCPSRPEPVGGLISLYHLANALARRGHEVHLGHLAVWGRELESLDQLSWFSFDPRVIHHHTSLPSRPTPESDVVFATGAPEAKGLPVLLVQGIDMLHPELERNALRTPSLKVCVASWLVDVGVAFGAPREQFAVVLCGLEPSRFVVRTPPEDRPAHVSVLAHHHQAKGWPVARAALIAARERMPEMTATAFGTTRPSDLPEWVDFRLTPDHDELAQIYDRSAVFLQASHYEGLGLTAIEAMSSGCALVTTDCGGSRDYATDGVTAVVTRPGDASGLASGIVDLLTDPTRRSRLAHAGRAHVQRFDWDRGAAELEVHLERYVADPAAYLGPPGPAEPFDVEAYLAASAPRTAG